MPPAQPQGGEEEGEEENLLKDDTTINIPQTYIKMLIKVKEAPKIEILGIFSEILYINYIKYIKCTV